MYLKYLWYVLRHKWFVLVECFEKSLYWQGLVHDLSKFRLSEFVPYARHFYGDIKRGRDETGYYKAGDTGDIAFDRAWLYHQHRNPHHWQYWVLTQDEDKDKVLEMPYKYVVEMFCDWKGAGRAQGTPNTYKWYKKHKDKMLLHKDTQKAIEILIYEL